MKNSPTQLDIGPCGRAIFAGYYFGAAVLDLLFVGGVALDAKGVKWLTKAAHTSTF
jgi:hypothetical protein